MEEVWKDVAGYEGVYQVSNLGRVKSLRMWSSVQRRYVNREKIRKPRVGNAGYYQVSLKRERTVKPVLVHRLVATAFIPNPENKGDVNHINGIKTDNRVENLEWNTRKENIAHSHRNGLQKHRTRKIAQCDLNGLPLREWASIADASRGTLANEQNIGACCRGVRKTAGGYIWRYKEAE